MGSLSAIGDRRGRPALRCANRLRQSRDRVPEFAPGRLAGGRAVWAGAGDLDGVGDVDEAVLDAGFGGPAFDLWSFDFDGGAAVAADQVVVVLVAGAAAVAGFAVVASEGVDLAGVGEGSELVVDGGEGDVLALGLKLGVKFLRGAETVGGF
jgi:hypothetical protein